MDELAISVTAGGLLSKASQLAGPVLKKFIQKRLAAGQKFNDLGEFGQQLQRQADAMKPQKIAQKRSTTQKLCTKSVACNQAAAKALISEILEDPKLIWSKSVDDLVAIFEQAGAKVTLPPPKPDTSGKAVILNINPNTLGVQQIEYHPGGGLHKGSYYRLSTSNKGKIKVVDRNTYEPTQNEKATIFYIN